MDEVEKQLNTILIELKVNAVNTAEFRGQMLEFKSTTERRLTTIDRKIDDQKQVCPYHDGLVKVVEDNQKLGREREKKIGDLEKKDIEIVAKLTPSEKTQLNITTLMSVFGMVWQIIKFVFNLG